MFSHDDVHVLLHDKRLRPPVASLYLNTDRGHAEGEKYLASFRHLLHEIDRSLRRRTDPAAALAQQRLSDAIPELLEFLDTEVEPLPAIRGVAMFLSLAPPDDYNLRTPPFTAFTLPRPVRNQMCVNHHPYIRPLLFLLDQYQRVGVIAADRTHARILTLFLGEVEHQEQRRAETPPHHQRGGWKQMLFQRDLEGHVSAHLRATARAATRLFERRPLTRVILAGSEEMRARLQKELPLRLRERVAGAFAADARTTEAEIVSRALAIAHEAELREEAERVREFVEACARRPDFSWGRSARARAVHGVEETLRAVSEGRVQRLLLRRGLRHPGEVCDNCGLLTTSSLGSLCPTCSSKPRSVTDILEYAVERAHEGRATIEFVTESPALDALGGVGALLRF